MSCFVPAQLFVRHASSRRPRDAGRTRCSLDAKDQILEIGKRTDRGTRASVADRELVEKLVSNLPAEPTNDLYQRPIDNAMFRGKWNLLYSTEDTLVSLMRDGLPLLLKPALGVYQTVQGGVDGDESPNLIQNIVEFPRPQGILRLVVSVSFNSENDGSRCRFLFNATDLEFPNDRTYNIPFAIGRGYFNVLYFDGQLRIDRDKNGWLNVYAYAGPIKKCTAPL